MPVLKSVASKTENATNELKQKIELTQNSNETKLKRKNRGIDRVACDDKNIESKAVDLINQFNKNSNQNLKKCNTLREYEN